MKYLTSLIFLFLCSCGRQYDLYEPEFAPYVQSFVHEMPAKWRHHLGSMPHYSMFGKTCSNKAIACVVSVANTHLFSDEVESVLIVDYLSWKKLSKYERKYLIWHELGHVVFRRKDTYDPSQRYKNLMYGKMQPNHDGRYFDWDSIKQSMK